MRASLQLHSGAPTGKAWMGWWGDMGGPKQQGIKTYSLSPNQTRAFKGVISGYIFNGYSRLAAQAPYVLIPLGTAYGVYVWANKTDEYNNSKAGHIAHGGAH